MRIRCAGPGSGAMCLALLLTSSLATAQVAEMGSRGAGVTWQPVVSDYEQLILTVSGPGGYYHEAEFPSGSQPQFSLFDAYGGYLPDGGYNYELRVVPRVSQRTRRELEALRATGEPVSDYQMSRSGQAHLEPIVQSGFFRIERGSVVRADAVEEPTSTKTKPPEASPLASAGLEASDDTVVLDDLIVDGSACIGFDCVNGESFGFDTIRVKENNLRIKFDDTSTVSSFPRNDWQLTANDSANGGASKFSIDDITGNRTPFTVEAGARSHSLYVDDGGRLGLRTSTPAVEIHTIDGDTPTLRLQQDGSSGFEPQTWDVAGNETNFFVRDVTNGSTLPFRIRPGAPSSSIFIDTDGNVGMGTSSPVNGALQVVDSEQTLLFLERTGGVAEDAASVQLKSPVQHWAMSISGVGLTMNELTVDGATFEMTLAQNGNMTISGTLTENSDRTTKTAIAEVEPEAVLEKVAALPIATWSRKGDENGVRHMGPMAQDFAAAFGLGQDDRSIATIDVGGVSLAAIQALKQRLDQKEDEIDALRSVAVARDGELQALRKQNRALADRLSSLETLVASLGTGSRTAATSTGSPRAADGEEEE